MNRVIRKSGYNDYIAVDMVDANAAVINTPLYLKAGEVKNCKIRLEWPEHGPNGTYDASEMQPGKIQFDGHKITATYCNQNSGEFWFEPTEFELLNPSVFHFN